MSILVILRGPSGSGKSTVARSLQERLGRNSALIEQDHVRRIMMWEKDFAGADNIGLIDVIARHCLTLGRITILDGILAPARYGAMLTDLALDWPTLHYRFDVSFEETARRHQFRMQARLFSPKQMRGWYDDAIAPMAGEELIPEGWSPDLTVQRIVERLSR